MIKKIIVLFILLLPVLVTASTFSTERTNVNNYMTRSNFKSTYKRYIMNKDSNEDKGKLMFYMDDNGKLSDKANNKDINAGFTDGGFISKREYLLTVPEKGTSYLYDGSTYWTLTCNNESKKCFVIEYIGIINQSGIVEYLNNETIPNIRSKATEFVKKDTKVTGTGKKSDPWIFVPKYKLEVELSDKNKADMVVDGKTTDEYETYLNAKCTGTGCYKEITLKINDGYSYLSNNCDGTYDYDSKKLKISNLAKDTKCKINIGVGKFKVLLGDKTWDNVTPKIIYLRHRENFYTDNEYTKILYNLTKLPERTGYDFLGYYYNDKQIIDDNGKVVDKVSVDKDNALLVSNWKNRTYTVTFNENGGNINQNEKKKTVTYDKAYGTLPNATKAGSSFDGWYTQASGGTKVVSTTILKTASDHVLYAHYKPCTADTYNTGDLIVCTPCPKGYKSAEGATAQNQCYMNVQAGKYLVAKANEPTNCAKGTYRAGAVTKYYGESVSCTSCPAGKYSGAGATSCTNCPAGKYSGAGAGSCTNCPAGKTSAAGASSCTTCSNSANVASWSSGCTIASCKSGYILTNNTCKLTGSIITFNKKDGITDVHAKKVDNGGVNSITAQYGKAITVTYPWGYETSCWYHGWTHFCSSPSDCSGHNMIDRANFNGYWTKAKDGTQVFDNKGKLKKSVSGFSDKNGKWIRKSNVTLYAQYKWVTFYGC